ncbi:hypothetical protein [Cellulomonas sp. NPDC058312]|uniref:hypothetical protein n=1 Tax=Cellulomonas sp. NPDC058312 TaxID=3346441 RepID=UPI0036E64DEA
MRWTDEDPGAGDVHALRHLSRQLTTTVNELADVHWEVRSRTGTLTEAAWSGQAGDAWRDSAQTCVDNLRHLLESIDPATDALTAYANRVEEIAEEAAVIRRRQDAASTLLRSLHRAPETTTAAARTRWRDACDDASDTVRAGDRQLQDLADQRRAADTRLRGQIDPVRAVDWDLAGVVSVPAPVRAAGPSVGVPDGAVRLAQVGKDTVQLGSKARAYRQFVRSGFAPVAGRPRAALREGAKAAAALRRFCFGGEGSGVLARMRVPGAAVVGRAFLPVTIYSGVSDALTGGGYSGGRGAATRALGAVGAAGATALLASSMAPTLGAGALALGPVGLAVAGAAVLAYGAWSLGNLVWDHREAIGDFLGSAWSGIGDAAARARDVGVRAASAAVDWARDRIGSVTRRAADAVGDVAGGLLRVLSFGSL